MQEIRLGLEKSLDISVYAKKIYTWQKMRKIRLELEQELEEQEEQER